MKNQKGFTLIELLVVIAIIGILSGIAFVSISGARESAYDTQIKAELSQVRTSAEMHYYDLGGTYGGGVVGVTAYDESATWDKIADQLPPCSAAVQDSLGYDNPDLYQINVGNQRYITWAALCTAADESGTTHFYCIDSEGNVVETTTDPETVKDSYICPGV